VTSPAPVQHIGSPQASAEDPSVNPRCRWMSDRCRKVVTGAVG